MSSNKLRIKVLYILPYTWGGLKHYTAELANAVSKYADVTVITPRQFVNDCFNSDINIINNFDNITFSINHPIKSLSSNNFKNFLSFSKIKIIYDINPDIIHLTTPIIPPLSIYMYLYKINEHYPIVFTKHGIKSNVGFNTLRLFEEITSLFENLIKFNKIIVHGNSDKEILINMGLKPKNIVIISHGAYSFFRKWENDIREEKNSILFFGYLKRYKGLDYLIKSVPIIQKVIPDIKVIIAGEGDFSEYEKLIYDKSRFEVHNSFIPDYMVSELFQRAKIIVLPYTTMSGQSGIANIAYSFGKPVIATNVGDLTEIVDHGKTGYLIPPKDSKAIAESVITLLENEQLNAEMGKKALEKAEIELSWNKIARKTVCLYKSLLND